MTNQLYYNLQIEENWLKLNNYNKPCVDCFHTTEFMETIKIQLTDYE